MLNFEKRDILEVKVTEGHIHEALVNRSAGACQSCAIYRAIQEAMDFPTVLVSYTWIGFRKLERKDKITGINYICSAGLSKWQEQLISYQESKSPFMPKPIIIIFDKTRERAYIKGEE